jgi:hypothetical protein
LLDPLLIFLWPLLFLPFDLTAGSVVPTVTALKFDTSRHDSSCIFWSWPICLSSLSFEEYRVLHDDDPNDPEVGRHSFVSKSVKDWLREYAPFLKCAVNLCLS